LLLLDGNLKNNPVIMSTLLLRWVVRSLFLYPLLLSAQDAQELVRRVDQKTRGDYSYSQLLIRVERPGWNREIQVKNWTKGKDYAMILILSPSRDKGISYLKRKKEVWNWIPSIERNIKLPPSMMSQSWMGTDFTNDDLVKEASLVEDYTHSLEKEEMIQDRKCMKIILLPKQESAVVWGKVILWIDPKDMVMVRSEYYDEEGKLINTLRSLEFGTLGGRFLPTKMEMLPKEKKDQKTIMVYKQLVFDQKIADDFFTPANMSRLQ
jgi:outer membrane lipoprotein-sorting protein